jgi:hypothetical protein
MPMANKLKIQTKSHISGAGRDCFIRRPPLA